MLWWIGLGCPSAWDEVSVHFDTFFLTFTMWCVYNIMIDVLHTHEQKPVHILWYVLYNCAIFKYLNTVYLNYIYGFTMSWQRWTFFSPPHRPSPSSACRGRRGRRGRASGTWLLATWRSTEMMAVGGETNRYNRYTLWLLCHTSSLNGLFSICKTTRG